MYNNTLTKSWRKIYFEVYNFLQIKGITLAHSDVLVEIFYNKHIIKKDIEKQIKNNFNTNQRPLIFI